MNEYDSGRISDFTKAINYRKTENFKEADCFVLNTCHIREKATEKMFHEIGRIKKEYKDKKKPIVLITGCVAQAEGEIILKKSKYVDAVIGPQSYQKINEIIKKIENNNKEKIDETNFDVIKKFDTLSELENQATKVFNYITIQEGCDKFCKFCVVPYTRGPEYSRSLKEILLETNQLVYNGAKEITLLGQNVNAYNFENKKLSDIISEISKIKNLKRIRYTTSHPRDFSEDLIDAHKNCEKLMPLVHLPVQSGSNKVLKAMNRKHTIEEYLKVVEKLIKFRPNIKFSSDFIIGYPTETNEDFQQTLKLMNNIKFINSYSFIFSARPGTPAYNLESVSEKEAKKRLIKFQFLADKIKINYRKELINKNARVLFENKVKNDNKYFGRDEYFNSVIVESKDNLIGKIKNVKILNVNQNTLFGEIISNLNQTNYAA